MRVKDDISRVRMLDIYMEKRISHIKGLVADNEDESEE